MRSENMNNTRQLRCQFAKILIYSTGWPKKSKPPPILQKIALKIANEIRFLRKVKVCYALKLKHYNTIRW